MSNPVPSAAISAALAARRRPPEAVLDHLRRGSEAVVGLANGEPKTVLDAIEAAADHLTDVRLHQMLPLRARPYMRGAYPGLRHVSWFLGSANREAFQQGQCELVPADFSEVPHLMRRATRIGLVLAAAAPPDRHGYFSLGVCADYSAALIGHMPFFLEVNHRMPRTFGENQVHISQVLGWCEADYPLVELPPPLPTPADQRIAALVAARIDDGATLQIGFGSIPGQVLSLLGDHRELGVHTELFGDGLADLVERGAITGTRKRTHRCKMIATNVIGTQRLFDFVDANPGLELWPVDYTNDPRVIAREDHFVSVNASMEVDFLGQCASESLGSHYYSSSGGQADFARGAMYAEHGRSFITLHATADNDRVSRIVAQLRPGAAVTTFKNAVDCVVTEYGVAELRGSSIRQRTERLIAIAHPKFRDELTQQGRALGYL
ncbi:MAG: acetyl-CoA hydrolase/transferase C-terminal domain-containing protein [Deltaproteobacteria bacterium]|nr:acetyl-CoA hydrolase/transferase C-terminal domain-containing protein [Deltaproteobacteria bacterium]